MTGLRGCLKTYYDCSLKKVLAERRLILTAWQTCSRCKTDGVGLSNDAETTFFFVNFAVPLVFNPAKTCTFVHVEQR